ncbi:hypothetical protein M0813_09694 [Anaeramoeba flamelloides]|uniref:Uncharacterized protein n=1 Tax=Anaeramoeba flamelloides TaxID=1746091 RepID=A0ABQ8X4A0_9EUKA|nr:hypothetical protein M0813_09694 [Anaeramoeba flamelloides]
MRYLYLIVLFLFFIFGVSSTEGTKTEKDIERELLHLKIYFGDNCQTAEYWDITYLENYCYSRCDDQQGGEIVNFTSNGIDWYFCDDSQCKDCYVFEHYPKGKCVKINDAERNVFAKENKTTANTRVVYQKLYDEPDCKLSCEISNYAENECYNDRNYSSYYVINPDSESIKVYFSGVKNCQQVKYVTYTLNQCINLSGGGYQSTFFSLDPF